jgi:hypothetical protein
MNYVAFSNATFLIISQELVACFDDNFFLGLFADSEYEDQIFLRNVGLFSREYEALYPTRDKLEDRPFSSSSYPQHQDGFQYTSLFCAVNSLSIGISYAPS